MVGEKAGIATQVHQVYIRATPEAIWEAITSPEWNGKYGYRAAGEYDLKPGGAYRVKANPQMRGMGLPEVIIDGEVITTEPPRKLVQTYRFLFNPAHEAEGFTRLTWEIEPCAGGFCRLSVTHEFENAPMMAGATASNFNERGGGGWTWILSDIKSLLETGKLLNQH